MTQRLDLAGQASGGGPEEVNVFANGASGPGPQSTAEERIAPPVAARAGASSYFNRRCDR
jgi:hypothetical protein